MKSSRSSWIFSVVLLLLLTSLSSAQVNSFKHFGLDKSIFPSRIECISQSSSGELLVGTLAGLVIYDGYSFRSIGAAEGLAESSISSILVDENEILLGHWAGNISRYFLEKDSVSKLPISKDLNFSSVKQMAKVGGGIMILSAEGKVFYFHNGSVERVVVPVEFEKEKVIQIIQSGSDLFLVMETQILKELNDSPSLSWIPIFSGFEEQFQSGIILENNTWLLGSNRGSVLLTLSENQKPKVHWFDKTIGYSIKSMTMLNDDVAWLATDESGIVELALSTGQVKMYVRENGLSYNQVRDVFVDREGIAWVGTSAGLDQYLGDAFLLNDQRSGLPGSMIWDVQMIKQHLYVLSSRGVVKCSINDESEAIIPLYAFDLDGNEPRQIVFDGVDLIWILDAIGKVWSGSYGSNSFLVLSEQELSGKCIGIVDEDLWIGSDEGIIVMRDGKVLEHFTTETGLGGNRVTGIYYSKAKNETWITSLGGETTLYSQGKFKKFGTETGLTSTVIQDAAFDNDGNIWFATYDNGVYYYDGTAFQLLSQKVALTSNTTFALDIDKNGIVWIGHNWGLDRYDHAKSELEWFGEDEGFMGVEVNPGAITIDETSKIWLGTLMGVLKFDPSRVLKNDAACLLKIKKAHLGSSDLMRNVEQSFTVGDNSDLSVSFKGISLRNPSKNQFLYRLKGVHENWKILKSNERIEYLSLPVGSFEFELKAYNNSGVCSEEPLVLKFDINPPFYRTWWFYTLIFILIVLFIFLLDKYRVVNLLEAKHAVEEELALKEQEITDLDQEKKRLSSWLNDEMNLIGVLEEKNIKKELFASNKLKKFKAYSASVDDISSNGIININCTIGSLTLMVDVGVGGMAAHSLRLNLKNELIENLTLLSDKELILSELQKVISDLTNSFKKFKGINWFAAYNEGQNQYYAQSGMAVFMFSPGNKGIVEASFSSNNWTIEDASKGILVSSESMFEQLNASGTKTYSKTRFVEVVGKRSNENQAKIASVILEDFKEWHGIMEQFGDVVLYIWNHE